MKKVAKILLVILTFFLCFLLKTYTSSHAIYRDNLNTKVYLSVLDPSTTYKITLKQYNGENDIEIPVSPNSEVGQLPTPTKTDNNFLGWWTEASGGTKVEPTDVVTGNITYHAHWTKIVCKKASTLHTESCRSGGGCTKHGYTTSGDSSIITYGTIPTANSPIKGDAYDCDVNNNGAYDPVTERFYYIRESLDGNDNIENAILVHYTSFDENGQMDSSGSRKIYEYEDGKAYLPSSTLWTNPSLLNFDGKVSRYISHEDMEAACGNPEIYNSVAYLESCQFLMENSRYQSGSLGRSGIWVDKKDNNPYRIQTSSVVYQVPENNPSSNTVRPVIEIPYNTIDGYTERTSHKITLNPTLGEVSPTYLNRYYDLPIGQLPVPTRTGYRFEGWFTDNGTFENEVTENTIVTGNMTLYAKWEEVIDNLVYVFYIPGSCTFGGVNGTITSSTNNCISTINPTGSDIDYTSTANKYINTGIALYTHTNIGKDYEIGFTINNYVPGDNVTRATLMNTKKEATGYPGLTFRKNENTSDFLLQSRETSSSNAEYTVASNTVTNVLVARRDNKIYYSINNGPETFLNSLDQNNPEFDLTTWFGAGPSNATGTSAQRHFVGTLSNMYIKLESDTIVQNTITFHSEGGSADYYEKTVNRGKTIGSLPNASKSGYYFDGWYTAPGNSGTKVTENTIITSDLHCYAHWKNMFLVTFHGEGGNIVPPSASTLQVVEGQAIGTSNLPTAEQTGYYFDGWYTAPGNSGTKIDGTEAIESDEDYYAHWKILRQVSFNGHGGTVTPPGPIDVGDGGTIGEANLPTATKSGLLFVGWFTEDNGGSLINGNEIITSDVEYHAVYTTNCLVTFDGNGGTPSFSTKNVAYGTAIDELPIAEHDTDITKELEGWYTDLNDSTTKAVVNSTVITSNVTYHAKWVTTSKVAMIGTTRYDTLAEAVADVPTTGVKTTITMLNNTAENVTIDGGRNVYLNLNGKTVSHPNGTNAQVFTLGGETAGTLELTNGTVSSNKASGMINVNTNGTLKVNTGTILRMTGTRQAIYVNGGTLYVYDGTISNKEQRGAIHILGNGTATITGGTITSTNMYAIHNESGTLIIGNKDGVIDTTKPVIQGNTYGVAALSTFKFYDGIIKGQTAPVGKTSNTGNTPTVTVDTNETKISEIETGTEKVSDEVDDYKRLYLQYESNKYKVTLNANGGEVSPAVILVEPNDPIGTIPTPTRGAYTFEGWFDEATDNPVNSSTVPTGNMNIYADWSFTPTQVSFNIINDPMRVYYNNISTWKTNESTFQSNMNTNFNNYSCSECDGQAAKPYQNCPYTGEVQCDRPKGYSTGVTGTITVYKAIQSGGTWTKDVAADYVSVTSDGILYDMIPGETYYWELDSDHNIYGIVTAVGERRILEASGVRNIRDLGGFEVDVDGNGTMDGKIDYGRMFRGPKLTSTADVNALLKLGITEEIDLRGSNNEPKISSNYQAREIVNYEIDQANYPTNYTALRNALSATMDDVISGENVYFHCAIGTDRTGTLAWFLEGLLGVSEEDRVEDYELSYFYGLLNRHRFYSYQQGSDITHRFVYMYNLYQTNTDIYNYYTVNGTDAAAVQRVQDFRDAVITYNSQQP